MTYTVSSDQWRTVFAVPTSVVDQHILICGAAALRALLIILRSGGSAGEEEIARRLSMDPPEVRDALRYWIQTGILTVQSDPSALVQQPHLSSSSVPSSQLSGIDSLPSSTPPKSVRQTPPVGVSTYRGRPTSEQIAAMMEKDPNIEFLFQSAANQLGKYLHLTDRSSLIYLYDWAGIPIDVILMVIQYCCSIGKKQMRYIERVALNWLDQGVNSLETAEAHIHKLEEQNRWDNEIKSAFGIRDRDLVEKEQKYIQKWYQEYHSGIALIRLAYERTIENIGRLSFPYVDSILKSWHKKGITTPEQALQEREKPASEVQTQPSSVQNTSYNLDEIEQLVSGAERPLKNPSERR